MPESDLRHRRRDLEQHGQRSRRCEREPEPGYEHGEKRRVDIAVTVHHQVGGAHQKNGRVNGKPARHAPGRSRRSTRAKASSNSAIRSRRAAATSTARPIVIAAPTRIALTTSVDPGRYAEIHPIERRAARPITIDATSIFMNATARRPPSSPLIRLRKSNSSAPALKIAASAVPSASPLYPITRTSARLMPRFASTDSTLTTTGVRLSRKE